MKTHSPSPQNRGFTLIELLVVITIIVILAGLSMGGYGYIARKQAESQATIQISLLSKALEEYKLDFGTYPPTGIGSNPKTQSNILLRELYQQGANKVQGYKIYIADLDPINNKHGWTISTENVIRDPWGNEYRYRTNVDGSGNQSTEARNPDFDLWSAGKDGVDGTADDIDNF
jgi:prepilin-type N-terminal cleavage/methylation domain-containing protein